MENKLTPKQKRFVDEYLIDLNATQAAIRAGYSPKTAQEQSSRLLSKVMIQAEIKEGRDRLQNKLEITQEKVLQELAAIAFANGSDFAKVEDNDTVKLIPTNQLSANKLPAIAGIKAGQYGIEVKLHDKVKALELIGKYLGTFESNAAQNHAENNLLDAINSCGEEGIDDLPEIQQASEDDGAVVEDGKAPK